MFHVGLRHFRVLFVWWGGWCRGWNLSPVRLGSKVVSNFPHAVQLNRPSDAGPALLAINVKTIKLYVSCKVFHACF